MLRYTLLRIVGAIPTLLLVIALAFMMVHAAPGGPFDNERVVSAEIEANIAARYHLDDPLPVQFLRYLGGLLQGDLGPSYRYVDYSVGELIGNALPYSMLLGTVAMALALVLGVGAGVAAALRQGTALDRIVMGFSMTGISIPVFVVAPVLVLLFAVKLHWLPAGWSGASGVGKYVLPVITLALPQIAYIARLARASMIDVLGRDFIRTARAQGYRERSLALHGWICARCAREFEAESLHLLTVHHKDGNHEHNPPDGSNWENLCVYCHEAEHTTHTLGAYLTGRDRQRDRDR